MTNCLSCGGPLCRRSKYGYCSLTKKCSLLGRKAAVAAYWRKHPDEAIWRSAKLRAKRRGVEFTITLEDVKAVWTETCPALGYELKAGESGRGECTRRSFSLDRIDNSKGYVPGNIQILSQRANAMKSDASPDELLQFAAWINATYGAQQEAT